MSLDTFSALKDQLLRAGKTQQMTGFWAGGVQCPCCGSYYGVSWDFMDGVDDPTARDISLCLDCLQAFEEFPIYEDETLSEMVGAQ